VHGEIRPRRRTPSARRRSRRRRAPVPSSASAACRARRRRGGGDARPAHQPRRRCEPRAALGDSRNAERARVAPCPQRRRCRIGGPRRDGAAALRGRRVRRARTTMSASDPVPEGARLTKHADDRRVLAAGWKRRGPPVSGRSGEAHDRERHADGQGDVQPRRGRVRHGAARRRQPARPEEHPLGGSCAADAAGAERVSGQRRSERRGRPAGPRTRRAGDPRRADGRPSGRSRRARVLGASAITSSASVVRERDGLDDDRVGAGVEVGAAPLDGECVVEDPPPRLRAALVLEDDRDRPAPHLAGDDLLVPVPQLGAVRDAALQDELGGTSSRPPACGRGR